MMIRFLWAAQIYRDGNKSCTAGIKSMSCSTRGPWMCNSNFNSNGDAKKKKKNRKQARSFSWKRSLKIRIDPSLSWPLQTVFLEHPGCPDLLLHINQCVITIPGSGNHEAPAQVWMSVCHHDPIMYPQWPSQLKFPPKHLPLGFYGFTFTDYIPC